ncbi:MAG TPA: molybdopterin molybdotransferase MoeA [Gammaproteobacteria bacterium]|nr:molybdopterin molybdotransferase MoeA [Gammaproteobacteria bacterium]
MIEVAEAEALIAAQMPRFRARHEPLAACGGRVLAEDVLAERDQPPFDRVTMDGVAISFRDWARGVRSFEVQGTQAAGAAPLAVAAPAQCVEVMTGTPLPSGVDTVVPVERVQRSGTIAAIEPTASVTAEQFVHRRGSDRLAGSVVLRAGTRLGPPEMAVLAGAGRGNALVTDLPRVAVISTGDELVEAGVAVAPHQIRSTNDRAVEASVTQHRLGQVTRARLRDDASALAVAIDRLDTELDVLVLSGGVSMGQFDFVPSVLTELGAKLVFHKVAQRPGRPMWFGVSARGKPIFALPGNPVSTLVCATRYLLPALRQASGLTAAAPELVELTAPIEASPTLTLFTPVTLSSSPRATLLAAPHPTNTSGDFVTLAGTDGFVELAAKNGTHPAGTVARLFRW